MPASRTRTWPLLALLAALPVLFCLPTAPARPAPPPPRLAVLVFFDQLRGDYLERWDDLFGKEGFRRLETEGAWFQNCHYPYAYTVTGAGHASVATGCSPERHGIVGNEWYDRAAADTVNCVTSERYERVPPKRLKEGDKKPKGVSPLRLLQPTLADALKAATAGKARIVSLSIKNRSAVLPGGLSPDACYWLDLATGEFVTSTYYRDRLHPWAADYNKGRPADHWLGKDWARLRTDLDYERRSGPDDGPGEGSSKQGRTFPHPMSEPDAKSKSRYYEAVFNSPFGNDLLLGLAKRAIDGEKLGTRAVPDLLCLSFSSNDAVGHTWGPDSQEVLDVTLRSDLIVKELLAHLDARVGRGRYVLALTADHGICPLPEAARKQGKEAARIAPELLKAKAEAFLDSKFGGKSRWVEATVGPWVYLSRTAARGRALRPTDVEDALAGWLRKQQGVHAVYTRTQLLRPALKGDVMGQMARRSFHPDRSGDLFVVVKPYHLLAAPLSTGTNHGTPHSYDTHVPLLVYGPGVRPGTRKEAVTPQATAAVLARALGIAPPSGAVAPVPEGLFEAERR